MPISFLSNRDGRIDEECMAALWSRHERTLAAYVTSRLPAGLRASVDVDDVLQETRTSAWNARSNFRYVSPAAFQAWIRAIADRKLIDIKRTAGRVRRGGDQCRSVTLRGKVSNDVLVSAAASIKSPSRQASIREAVGKLGVAMEQLPTDMREALTLCELQGESIQDAARSMCRSPGSIRGLLYHGRIKLRILLGEPGRFLSDSGISTRRRPR